MTYVRVALDTFQPGTADEALRRVREQFVPLLQRQPGFLAYEIVRTGEDTALFIHVCETKAQAEAALQAVAGWARDNLGDMVLAVEHHIGELVFSSRT